MQLCGDSRRNLCGLPEFQIVRSVSKMPRVFVWRKINEKLFCKKVAAGPEQAKEFQCEQP
jgi:hypothetical protein